MKIDPIIFSLGEENNQPIGSGSTPGICCIGDGGAGKTVLIEGIIKQFEGEKNHPILVHMGTDEPSNGLGLINKQMQIEPFVLRNYHTPDLLPTNFMYDDKDTFNEAKHIESCNKARKKRKRKKKNR